MIYPFLQLANNEATAVAVTQAIVGTIGLVLTVPIAATVAGILTQYIKVKPSDIHQDLPSAEELEELFRADDPKSKARLAVPLALVVVLFGTLFLHHRVNHSSATIVEQYDENGELASRSEYAKGKVVRLLESNSLNETIEHDILEIELLSGLYKGQRIMMRNILNYSMPSLSIPAKPGDFVLCRVGGTPNQIGLVNLVQEFGRDGFLIWMVGLMMVLIIIVGRIEGVRTACAMVMSGLILYFFMLPRISQGDNAVPHCDRDLRFNRLCLPCFCDWPESKDLFSGAWNDGEHPYRRIDCDVRPKQPPLFRTRECNLSRHH